jgi:phosphoenolpyruvate carboxylase
MTEQEAPMAKKKSKQDAQAKLFKDYSATMKWIEEFLESISKMTPVQRKRLAHSILNWRSYLKW